jgi:hypothetical protein
MFWALGTPGHKGVSNLMGMPKRFITERTETAEKTFENLRPTALCLGDYTGTVSKGPGPVYGKRAQYSQETEKKKRGKPILRSNFVPILSFEFHLKPA